jgi:hypothetical protein
MNPMSFMSGQFNISHFADRKANKEYFSPHTVHEPAIIVQMSLPIQKFAKCADVFHRQKDLKGHTCLQLYNLYGLVKTWTFSASII